MRKGVLYVQSAPPMPLAFALTVTGGACQPPRPGVPVIVSMETGGMMSGGIGPRSGAQATRGSPRPTPRAPFDADTVNHVVASQLSTTERLPKIRSMSRAQGVDRKSVV